VLNWLFSAYRVLLWWIELCSSYRVLLCWIELFSTYRVLLCWIELFSAYRVLLCWIEFIEGKDSWWVNSRISYTKIRTYWEIKIIQVQFSSIQLRSIYVLKQQPFGQWKRSKKYIQYKRELYWEHDTIYRKRCSLKLEQ